MNEKTLEKVTGLSRRQIIMLQKTAIKRKGKVVVGISYQYSTEEVEEFMLAKFFKDCGYNYPEIKIEMDNYRNNKVEVLDKAISKMQGMMSCLKKNLIKAYELKDKAEKK